MNTRAFFILFISIFAFLSKSITQNKCTYEIHNIAQNKVIYYENRCYTVDTTTLSIKIDNIEDFPFEIIRYNKLGYADIKIPLNLPFETAVHILESDERVSKIIYSVWGNYCDINVSDTLFHSLWGLRAINIPQIWDYFMGRSSVIVAVIDAGTDWMHPDLGLGNDGYHNFYTNENDSWSQFGVPSTGNGFDDDNNGLYDDYIGWNYEDNDNDCRSSNYHGTFVSGIISAKTNNVTGISGVVGGNNSQGVKILPYCVGTWSPMSSVIDDAIFDAVDKGAKVIQLSLEVPWDQAIDDAIRYAFNNNVILVCSAGNNTPTVCYPAKDTNVIAVGAIDSNYLRASFSSYDVTNVSLVAPGDYIWSTTLNNSYTFSSGTSFAAPYVSGVAALVFSVRPDFSSRQVKDILETTAQKLQGYSYNHNFYYHPNGTWNDETGYGLVDAYAAVQAAGWYDLYTRDNDYDNLSEPNTGLQPYFFYSPDIWVRKYRDTITRSQTITIEGTNYVFVRVHNNGPVSSSAHNDSVKLFAKANASTTLGLLDNSWLYLGAAEIPEIPAGRDTIVCVKVDFPHIGSAVDFAIYSKIESVVDPLAFSETIYADTNVRKNNNISAINVQVLDHYTADDREANFIVSRLTNNTTGWEDIRIKFGNQSQDSTILDFAEITLKLNDDLLYHWQNYMDIDGLKHIKDNEYLVTERSVTLPQIPNTTGEYSVTIKYNFLTKKVTMRDFFNTYVLQYKNDIDEQDVLIGGFTIQVEKPERTATSRFHVNAGNDTAILIGTNATLHATQINETATYRWYDKQRTFKYEGLNYIVTPTETSEYILEVTAESDGYRDLDTVKVNVVPGCIRSITPNPVSDNWVTVSYEYASTVTSAHLYIYNTGTTTLVGNYDLSNLDNVGSLDIEVTNYPTGSYTVVLVCDNAVCHSKVLIKQ